MIRFARKSFKLGLFAIALLAFSAILVKEVSTAKAEKLERPAIKDFNAYNAALKEAAMSLLPHLVTNRNAIFEPPKWPYWTGFCPPKVRKFKDMTFDSALVPWEKMSYKEKQLLFGYPGGSEVIEPMFLSLATTAYAHYNYFHSKDLDLLSFINPHLLTMNRLATYLSSFISPITGRLIEVNHPEFSPGNAYVRIVTEEEVRELVELDPSVDEWWNYSATSSGVNDPKDIRITLTGKEKLVDPRFTPPGHHEPFLVYVRLYGEKGVLFEGLL